MELATSTIKNIIATLRRTQPNEIDCGECFDRLDQFAEMTLEGKSAEEALPLVKLHLDGCLDCRVASVEALLDMLRSIGGHEQTPFNSAT